MNEQLGASVTEALDRPPSRYVVGIDLGTTNCAMAFVDTQEPGKGVQVFRIPQLVDWGAVEELDTLPSFHYQLTDQESTSIRSPWLRSRGGAQSVVGVLARDRGMQMPGRQIASAKSWLCHAGVDRTASLLPWHGDEDVQTLSPVEASSQYLAHLRQAWDRRFPQSPLAEQDVAITLPASFDEIARSLTVEAAKLAGLERIILIEEPQAAFYAWLARHESDWTEKIRPGESVLICDIGGGTTDFTLIRVSKAESGTDANPSDVIAESEVVKLQRVAVGQHLILGGDNLDLALAHAAEANLTDGGQKRLTSRQWDALRLHCRVAKETMLGPNPPASYTLTIPGSGSRLLENSLTIELDKQTIKTVLLDGFFPKVQLTDRPATATSGFQEFGLPYASDPAISRHLASFLWDHRWDGRSPTERSSFTDVQAARPDWILFNGGVLESSQIRQRIVDQVIAWFRTEDPSLPDGWKPGMLEGNRLDLAVAIGAAYYGMVRRGVGVRIDATLARSYYLMIQQDPPEVLCIVPGKAIPGDQFLLQERPLELLLNSPIQLPLFVSSTRLVDEIGSVGPLDVEQMSSVAAIRTVLELPKSRRRESIQVLLHAELTEIGTLHLKCLTPDHQHQWRLEFDVRSSFLPGQAGNLGVGELDGIVDESLIETARSIIAETFSPLGSLPPKELIGKLEQALTVPRADWKPSLLREMWRELIELDEGRKRSPAHEARWLNLVGYCLRPGYGMAADDWRVATTWRKVQGKLAFANATSAAETIILWRRIAGGFTAGQQRALYQDLQPRLRSTLVPHSKASISTSTNETMELLRLAGSLELLRTNDRLELGAWCLQGLKRAKLVPLQGAMLWTLGRLGTRAPAYGPIHQLVPLDAVTRWITTLLELDIHRSEMQFAVVQMARKTGDRYRDIDESLRNQVLIWLAQQQAADSQISLVREVHSLSDQQQTEMFGESLPLGLRMAR